MSGCSAVGCLNSQKKGFRVFKFPSAKSDSERRKRWMINCRKDKFEPTEHSRICEVYFEDSQWECNRADDWKKLKPNAVPTIFNTPNPPKLIGSNESKNRRAKLEAIAKAKCKYKDGKKKQSLPATESESAVVILPPEIPTFDEFSNATTEELHNQLKTLRLEWSNEINLLQEENKKLKLSLQEQISNVEKECVQLIKERERLKQKIANQESKLQFFLTGQQITSLNKQKMKEWDHETIMKALKMRFHLGVNGYEFLRSTNYPLPSLKTLSNRFQKFQVITGVLEDLNEPIAYKMHFLDPLDQYCSMVVDEMQIKSSEDYDKIKKKFMGYVSLGDESQLGTHIVVVLIRGLKTPWKQIIAVEVTGSSTKPEYMGDLLSRCLKFVESLGLTVVSLTSDMGGNNTSLWSKLGVKVTKYGERNNTMTIDGTSFAIIPDTCHLLKNLRNAIQKHDIFLPEEVMISENLPCSTVSSKYVTALWRTEVNGEKAIRSLFHLKSEDINPNNFEKMDVGSAVKYFSEITAVGIETAIELKFLPPAAKTTAWFIRKVHEWFELVSSRILKKSITRRNQIRKIEILESFIGLFHNLRIGQAKSWKPLNWGMILSCLSLINISQELLHDGFSFLLHRFNQDCLENVFSQIRRKSGATPTVSACLKAIKLISLAQITFTPKYSSYLNDSDQFLLDYFDNSKKKDSEVPNRRTIIKKSAIVESTKNVLGYEKFPTVISEEGKLISTFTLYDMNFLYKLAGGCIYVYLKKPICEDCKVFPASNLVETKQYMKYFNNLNHGGLTKPNKSVFDLIINVEKLYRNWKDFILRNNCNTWIDKVIADVDLPFPQCNSCYCLKTFIVNHYFKIRSFSLMNVNECKKRKNVMYGTATKKRKTI